MTPITSQAPLTTTLAAYQAAEARVVTVAKKLAGGSSIADRLVASTEAPRFQRPGASNARAFIAGIVASLPIAPSRELAEAKRALSTAKADAIDVMYETLGIVQKVERQGADAPPGYAQNKITAKTFLNSEDGLGFLARPKTMPEIRTWMVYVAVAECLA